MSTCVEVKVGQVWEDCDWRMKGRRIAVIALTSTHARVRTLDTGRQSNIRLNRFHPTSTGYRLLTGPT